MVPAVCICRERLQWCTNCVRSKLPLEQRVAVLLGDFHGYSDKKSADMLALSLPSFKLLLHKARAVLHQRAGGQCPLVSKMGTRAPCRCGAEECSGTPPASCPGRFPAQPSSGLATEALPALNAQLLGGLGLAD